MESIRKVACRVYSFSPVRWSIKFSICLFTVKAIGDSLYAWCYGRSFRLPRWNQLEGVQHPLNPPLLIPYPFPKNAYQM